MVYRACNFEGERVVCPSDTKQKISKLKQELPSHKPKKGPSKPERKSLKSRGVIPAAYIQIPDIQDIPKRGEGRVENAFLKSYDFTPSEIHNLDYNLDLAPTDAIKDENIISAIKKHFFLAIKKKVREGLDHPNSEFSQKMNQISETEQRARRDYALGYSYKNINGTPYSYEEYIATLLDQKDDITGQRRQAGKKMIQELFELMKQNFRVTVIPRRDGVEEYILVPADMGNKTPTFIVYKHPDKKIEVKTMI